MGRRAEVAAGAPLVVAHVLGRLSAGGGVQVVVRNLARSADPERLDLHAITYRPIKEVDALNDVPIRVHPLGFEGARPSPLTRLRLMAMVVREVGRLRASVVQLHSGLVWMGLLVRLRWPSMPIVVEVHDAPGSGRAGRGTDRFEGWFARRRNVTLVCHSTAVQSQTEAEWTLPAGRVRRFPLGIDTGVFRPIDDATRAAWRADEGIPDDALLVAAVGRSASFKRFELAVDAVAAACRAGADVHFVQFGALNFDLLNEHGEAGGVADRLHLLGSRVPGDEAAVVLASADVLSSTSEYEGFGLTLAEGMASGLAVVSMAAGGVVDLVVDGETGFLVDSGDVDAFAARLVELAADRERCRAMGDAGHRRAAELYSIEALADSFTRLYEELAGRPVTPGSPLR